LKRPAPEAGEDMGVLRLYEPADRGQILEITREADHGFRGRYHLDPHLPQSRSDELYVEGGKKACDGEWADGVRGTENGRGGVDGRVGRATARSSRSRPWAVRRFAAAGSVPAGAISPAPMRDCGARRRSASMAAGRPPKCRRRSSISRRSVSTRRLIRSSSV